MVTNEERSAAANEMVRRTISSDERRELGRAAADSAPMCKCGRAPCRANQRNCLPCNREANRKYRAELKKQQEALKQMLAGQ